jgi:Ca-activated chloride channel homolog
MNFADFHFIRSYWLLALLPAAGFFVALLRNRLGQGNWSEVCDAALLPYILQQRNSQQSRWPLTLASLSALLTILALAGPTWERMPAPAFRNAAALVIALDLSASMDAADIKPSRLTRARYKIADILKQRKDGQTALLVYAGDAFTVTPLTEDNETILGQLNALQTHIMPVAGSNTHTALKLATSLLQQAGLQQGHILMISDGIDPDIIDQASNLLGNYHLSVLGVGTAEGAPVKMPGGGFIKDSAGNILVPKLDNAQLAALASAGNGSYQTISANDSDIEKLLASLDKPVTHQDEQKHDLFLEQWDDKGPWLILLILPLAALSFRKGFLSVLFVLLLPYPQDSHALEWRDLWHTNNQQAQRAFQQNDFERAAEQFDSSDWKAAAQYKAGQYQEAAESLQSSTTADGHYNRGNALAKAGQLQQALEAYEQTLKLDPQHSDAQYNKNIVEQALQQDQPQQGDDSQQSDQQDQQNQEGNPEQNDDQQQADSSSESETQEQQQSEDDASQAEQQQAEPTDEQQDQETQASQQQAENSESDQATEQWLNRIPDDPSGLLKRKFRYQYGQRKKQGTQ